MADPISAAIVAIASSVSSAVATVGAVASIYGASLAGALGLSGAGILAVSSAAGALATSLVIGEALTLGSSLLNSPPKIQSGGSPVEFKADPQGPIPYAIGRTGTGGNIVFADVAGSSNKYLSYVTVLSGAGPIQAIESFHGNDIAIGFALDSGEGASSEVAYTTTSVPVAVGATVIPVSTLDNFKVGDTVTIGPDSRTIEHIYAPDLTLEFDAGLSTAEPIYTPVTSPLRDSQSLYRNRMWQVWSLGPSSAPALAYTATGSKDTPADHGGQPPEWTAAHKLSGLAAVLWGLEFDAKVYPTGTPKPLWVVRGVKVYDPRLDGTYPGGVGLQRITDETTWTWSENPFLHALAWVVGRRQNGKLCLGVGAPIAGIDIAAFVESANVCDANGWRVGGTVVSTDSKWDVLRAILQAGGGEPLQLGAMISCRVKTPRPSLATLTGDDVVGEVVIPAMLGRRARLNSIWPRYREEAQDWQVVPTQAIVTVPDYVTADGGQRSKEVTYALVQSATQAAQLARYDIEDAREFGPVTIPCKPQWMGYKAGDCFTVDEPEYGLTGQKVMILTRQVDPATLTVTLTVKSETDAKHAFALGQVGKPPAAPGLSLIDLRYLPAPTDGVWSAAGATLTDHGASIPAIVVTNTLPLDETDNANAEAVVFELRVAGAPDWTAAGIEAPATRRKEITGLTPGTAYDVAVSYRVRGVVGDRRVLIGAVAGDLQTTGTASSLIANSWTNPAGIVTAHAAADGTKTVTIADHHRVYADRTVAVTGATLTGLVLATGYWLYYDDAARAGGPVAYAATADYTQGFVTSAYPSRHAVGTAPAITSGDTTPVAGGGRYPPGYTQP